MAAKKNPQQKTAAAKRKPKSVSKTSKAAASTLKQMEYRRESTRISSARTRFGDSILDEVILLFIIAGSIIVFISLFATKTGALGQGINSLFKGLLGISSFFLPLLLISYCFWLLFSKERPFPIFKILGGVLFLLSFCIFFHALNGSQASGNFFENIVSYYKNGTGINGGMIGGILGGGMVRAFNRPLTYLISIVLLLASLILATGKSFFSVLGRFLLFIGAAPKRKREKIIYKADHIRKVEQEKEIRKIKKQEQVLERKKRRKGYFDIQIREEEGYHEDQGDMPIIHAMDFKKKIKNPLPPKNETIYDYNKEVDCLISHSPSEVEEIKENVKDVLEELDQASKTSPLFSQVDLEPVLQPIEEKSESEPFYEPLEKAISPTPAKIKTEENSKEVETLAKMAVKSNLVPDPISEPIHSEPEKEKTSAIPVPPEQPYQFPPIDLLGKNNLSSSSGSKAEMLSNAKKLEDTLKSFGVEAKVIQINKGPTVTRYELSPSQGVKVSKIVNLTDDIALNLAASGIRVEAPIPGKAAVGIEVPNQETQPVFLGDVIDSEEFQKFPSKLAFALGQDISGNPVVSDIAKMPHLLVAGATGSGKSVCINTLITSILYKADPKEVKLILVDPKVVELSIYNGIPHLLIPVVTDPKKAAGALNWAVREMLSRYQIFAEHNVRDIKGYNTMKKEKGEEDFMPQIVIIIDELADLMMAAPGEVEDSICRLAQMARAAGLHLIIATQRPSVDVITGLIKANIPSRLAFAVSSGTDSKTILNSVGAEKLLGKGDMLFYPVGKSKPVRIQGAFITDKEVENIVNFVKVDRSTQYEKELSEKITSSGKNTDSNSEDSDEFLDQAIALVVKKEKASVSMLQRQFRIGYNRAARLMEDLENRGIVGPEEGSKPRKVLMSLEELEEYQESGGYFS